MSGSRRGRPSRRRNAVSPIEDSDDDEVYDIAPPPHHGNPFQDETEPVPDPAAYRTPSINDDLILESDVEDDEVDYEDVPPPAHYHHFDDEDSSVILTDDEDGEIIIPAPPGDYRLYFDDEYSDENSRRQLLKPRSLLARGTVLSKILSLNSQTDAKSMTSKDNKEQAKNALRIADKVTKIPLGPIWHKATQVFFMTVFLTNIGVAIADMAIDKDPLYYKLTSLFFGVLEQIGLFGLWIFLWAKRKKDPEFGDKRQQYIENILHEVLLYPLLILSIVGFTTDKFYEAIDTLSFFEYFQLALLGIDMLNLFWTQLVRMYMLHRFMQDLNTLLNPDGVKGSGRHCGLESPGNILQRAYVTFVGNTILLVYLTVIMGAQIHTDNDANQYTMSWRSGVLALCFVALPIFSVVLFLLVNSFWVLEILMTINVKTATDVQFQGKLEKKYGHTVSDTLNLAVVKGSKTKKRLEGMQSIATWRKVLYALTAFWMIPLLLLWEFLAALPLLALLWDIGEDPATLRDTPWLWIAVAVYIIMLIVFNSHLLLVAGVVDLLLPVIILSVLFYPIAVPICFMQEFKRRN